MRLSFSLGLTHSQTTGLVFGITVTFVIREIIVKLVCALVKGAKILGFFQSRDHALDTYIVPRSQDQINH